MKNIPTITINNPNKPININVPNTGITGNKFTDWSGSNNNFIQSSNNSSNNLGKFNVPNINAPNVHHSTQHHKPSSFNNHGIDVQKQYGDAFNNIPPAAQKILAGQNHEPWDNPCYSAVVHMIREHGKFGIIGSNSNTIDFCHYKVNLEHRFDHPVHYSHTLDFSNFPALSGITKCGDHVTSNIAHWINLKSTGQLGTNVGNKVFANFNTIKLNHNNIGDDAVEPILNSLSYQTLNLTTLKLSHNHLGDGFVKLFLNATSKDNGRAEHSIKNIVLHHNFIGDDGAMMFGDALKNGQLPNTKYIDVSGNKITKDGETKLVQALKGKVQDMIIITQKLEQNSKLFPGIGTKDEKIAIYKEFIKQGIEKGTYDKGIVVDKSLWGEIKNLGNQLYASKYAAKGFVKCNWKPEEMVKSYAQDKITAKISKAFSKILGQFTDIEGIVSCYLEASDAGWTSPPGMKTVQHELCVLGEQEFCGD